MLSGNFDGVEIQHGFLRGLNFGPGIFLAFVWSPKGFLPIKSFLSLLIWSTLSPLGFKSRDQTFVHLLFTAIIYVHAWIRLFIKLI